MCVCSCSQAVYGVLSSIDGLDTFHDLLVHMSIGTWYFSMKELVHGKQKEK